MVQRAVPEVEWCVTCDWAGVVAQLLPTSPRALLVDKSVLSDGVPSKLASVRRDLSWLPVIVLAEASELPGDVVLALVEARVRHFVCVETLEDAEGFRSALGL